MKKFIVGFLLGTVLTAALPISAAVQQYVLTPATYPIMVDGVELNDPDYPVLNYNGTTYLSLRKTAEAVDADLSWNDTKKQVEITSKKPDDVVSSENKKTEGKVDEIDEKTEEKEYVKELETMNKNIYTTKVLYFNKGYGKNDRYSYEVVEYNGDIFVPAPVLSLVEGIEIENDGTNFYVKVPGKNRILVQTGATREAIPEVSVKYSEQTHINLRVLGLQVKYDSPDSVWLEWAE